MGDLRDYERRVLRMIQGRARRGVSLIEVLVAIFVMGLGMIALLTLFPVGAISMAQAIQYDRATLCAGNAAAAESIWGNAVPPLQTGIRFDSQVYINYTDPSETGNAAGFPQIPLVGNAGYPVFVDPWGVQSYSPLFTTPPPSPGPAYWVGGMDGVTTNPGIPLLPVIPPPGIRRQSVTFLNNATAPGPGVPGQTDTSLLAAGYRTSKLLSWSFLLDDMTFLSDGGSAGLPCLPGGIVQRDDRYSWAYLFRPGQMITGAGNKIVPDPLHIDVNIVVYSGRTLAATATGALEQTFLALFDSNTNTVRLTWTAGSPAPNIRKGSWILDATIVYNSTRTPIPPLVPSDVHGYFYRVTGITQSGPNSLDLSIQGSLRGFNPPASFNTTGPNNPGYIVVMDNVVDVFERNNFVGVQ
jgi:prepilin-type N-terminal cleavage/methylation domain-containing protein